MANRKISSAKKQKRQSKKDAMYISARLSQAEKRALDASYATLLYLACLSNPKVNQSRMPDSSNFRQTALMKLSETGTVVADESGNWQMEITPMLNRPCYFHTAGAAVGWGVASQSGIVGVPFARTWTNFDEFYHLGLYRLVGMSFTFVPSTSYTATKGFVVTADLPYFEDTTPDTGYPNLTMAQISQFPGSIADTVPAVLQAKGFSNFWTPTTWALASGGVQALSGHYDPTTFRQAESRATIANATLYEKAFPATTVRIEGAEPGIIGMIEINAVYEVLPASNILFTGAGGRSQAPGDALSGASLLSVPSVKNQLAGRNDTIIAGSAEKVSPLHVAQALQPVSAEAGPTVGNALDMVAPLLEKGADVIMDAAKEYGPDLLAAGASLIPGGGLAGLAAKAAPIAARFLSSLA